MSTLTTFPVSARQGNRIDHNPIGKHISTGPREHGGEPFPRPSCSSLRLEPPQKVSPRMDKARRMEPAATTYVRLGRKKKRSILSAVVELPVCRIVPRCERTSERASTSALARPQEWEIRRYKTDLVDWCQSVQRPDAAAALVARVRERRSRYSACGTPLTDTRHTHTYVCICSDQRTISVFRSFLGGDSVQDFREGVESEFARRACAYPKGN